MKNLWKCPFLSSKGAISRFKGTLFFDMGKIYSTFRCVLTENSRGVYLYDGTIELYFSDLN